MDDFQKWAIIAVSLVIAAFIISFILLKLLRSLRRKALMARYEHQEFVDSIMAGQIMRGMSTEMVLDVWGEPADLDETALKTKTKTEMKYDQKGKNRFGTRVYLEDGLVVGWEVK